jgi:hypothetical protein
MSGYNNYAELPQKFMKMKKILITLIVLTFMLSAFLNVNSQSTLTYKIVDTGEEMCYDTAFAITPPVEGESFYGQDAQYSGFLPSYTDNGDGTITDNVTGLMWQKSPDFNGDGLISYDDKMSYEEALTAADTYYLAGFSDWRLPTIKEQYSLILFSGLDPSGYEGTSTEGLTPFIDTTYFDFAYGDLNANERIIDAQYATSTLYVSTTMGDQETMFGVNFADGRIKGYPTGPMPGQTVDKQFYVSYVRGNPDYGINSFTDNGDGTITDSSTGLMWTKDDNGEAILWQDALNYAETSGFAGYTDWRLPNAKELQSIVDYTRSPATSNSAAIDPVFNCTQIINEGGDTDYPFYWTSTTHANWTDTTGIMAAYVCFGTALGWMQIPPNSGNYILMDVHGAGAQRSDPKVGDPDNFPYGHGPQGDVVRIYHYVRCVRDACTTNIGENEKNKINIFPNPVSDKLFIRFPEEFIGISSVEILNEIGKVVLKANGNFSVNEIDISRLSHGIYFIQVINSSGKLTGKFIKQ